MKVCGVFTNTHDLLKAIRKKVRNNDFEINNKELIKVKNEKEPNIIKDVENSLTYGHIDIYTPNILE